ncbi:hypothetical protein [Enterococcus sp. BWR-S5]|uniref:hypothetical protein n=1 Tax=Enterococcus sp. BWR-S5 TaxID=2787714 RepID=UPI00192491EA|nr:hypothetical protein [Enterococcus sp. BWR-S5]MBL1227245.1 hypothetical protein [Enterococcus sp. BWR-S5]
MYSNWDDFTLELTLLGSINRSALTMIFAGNGVAFSEDRTELLLKTYKKLQAIDQESLSNEEKERINTLVSLYKSTRENCLNANLSIDTNYPKNEVIFRHSTIILEPKKLQLQEMVIQREILIRDSTLAILKQLEGVLFFIGSQYVHRCSGIVDDLDLYSAYLETGKELADHFF